MTRTTTSFAALILAATFATASAETPLPANLGGGLQNLVAWYLANAPAVPAAQRHAALAADQPAAKRATVSSQASRAVVDVRLDGSQPLANVRAALEALGCTILGAHEAAGPRSVISTRMPLAQAVAVSKVPGVFSLILVHRPKRHVGATTSQGVAMVKADLVQNLGYTGAGITVGAISDSYDVTAPHAAADITSGDLPGVGNTKGHLQPVNVIEEGDATNGDVDEGRAMLQIIHDVAPGAALAFAAVGDTEVTFADRIRALRTTAHCDVIVDDISFPSEPFFSDGIVAQAVDDVVHSNTLAGRPVAYYSAAGNDGTSGFVDDFRVVADADARANRPKTNLKLRTVPPALTAGGFHNFGSPTAPVIVQRLKVSADDAAIDLQWDDPFLPGSVTTDYNILVFNVAGTYMPKLSSFDDNVATGEPMEFASLPAGINGAAVIYQIAITRRVTTAPAATHLRYVAFTDGTIESTPFQSRPPTIYGHSSAPGADAVAAYDYTTPTTPESFTSLGPVTVYLDRNGQRLANPEIRSQPTIAAPDNVNTTFFPDPLADSDDDTFPNFSGTSAAAPHAAGVAALLLQAKGGPGSRTSTQLRTALQGSAGTHDLDPFAAHAVVQTADNLSTVTINATGDDSNNASFDPRFFKLSFTGPATRRLSKVVINLASTGLFFDPRATLGLPFRVGAFTGIKKTNVVGVLSGTPKKTILTLKFAKGTFAPGATVDFGIDRDLIALGGGGNSADFLQGATVAIQTLDNGVLAEGTGTFTNQIGKGYSPVDGFGLINAKAALDSFAP